MVALTTQSILGLALFRFGTTVVTKVQKGTPKLAGLEAELSQNLDTIRSEETPERLLELARELQRLLRARERPN